MIKLTMPSISSLADWAMAEVEKLPVFKACPLTAVIEALAHGDSPLPQEPTHDDRLPEVADSLRAYDTDFEIEPGVGEVGRPLPVPNAGPHGGGVAVRDSTSATRVQIELITSSH